MRVVSGTHHSLYAAANPSHVSVLHVWWQQMGVGGGTDTAASQNAHAPLPHPLSAPCNVHTSTTRCCPSRSSSSPHPPSCASSPPLTWPPFVRYGWRQGAAAVSQSGQTTAAAKQPRCCPQLRRRERQHSGAVLWNPGSLFMQYFSRSRSPSGCSPSPSLRAPVWRELARGGVGSGAALWMSPKGDRQLLGLQRCVNKGCKRSGGGIRPLHERSLVGLQPESARLIAAVLARSALHQGGRQGDTASPDCRSLLERACTAPIAPSSSLWRLPNGSDGGSGADWQAGRRAATSPWHPAGLAAGQALPAAQHRETNPSVHAVSRGRCGSANAW